MKTVYEIFLRDSYGSERVATVTSKRKAVDYIKANREEDLAFICLADGRGARSLRYGDKISDYLNTKELLNWRFAVTPLKTMYVKPLEVI